MQPIVVGLDGSPSSADALRWALGAASVGGAELLLVSVVPDGADAQAIELAMLREWAGQVQASGVPFRTEVVEGAPGPALTAVSAGIGDCLVVVGQGHDRWFPALHLGSASHYLAHHVDRPLCVVPRGHASFDPSHIVVGLDGSPGSMAAAQWAADLAARSGGKATTVYAWKHSTPKMTNVDTGPDTGVDADLACRTWASGLDEAGILTEARAVEGELVNVLAATVAAVGAGLVVLGTGSGVRPGVRLGSVALRVLGLGDVPVVLVPPSPRHSSPMLTQESSCMA